MQAYIKTRAAFRTAWARAVLDYSVTLDSLESVASTVRLAGGDIPRDAAGGWLSLAGSLWLISAVSPEAGYTDLELLSPGDLFNRPRPYAEPEPGLSVGGFIARELAAGWRDEPDAVYAMPYLDPLSEDATLFVPPEVDDTGYYVLSDYLRTVRAACGVECLFLPEPDADRLQVLIRSVPRASHVLVAGDGHTFLLANTFSRTAVAKVTTVQPTDSGQVDDNGEKIFVNVSTNWFLASDGSVGSQEPASRAFGEWQVLPVSEKSDAGEAAQGVFDKNTETHKVEFYTDFCPHVRDLIRLRLPSGQEFSGEISSVSRSRGDRRWLCQSGALATTLTDKVRKSSSSGSSRSGGSRGSSRGSSSAQTYAVGDVYITTREGDPAELLGYGAWDRIQGRFLLAADPTHPPGTRGGEAAHALQPEELPAGARVLDPENLSLAFETRGSGSLGHLVSSGADLPTRSLGGGQPFNLFPPYIALYVWVRKS